ncbi:uncharacterized protein METZ01_LOCUS459971, partial [marine metagenome]
SSLVCFNGKIMMMKISIGRRHNQL